MKFHFKKSSVLSVILFSVVLQSSCGGGSVPSDASIQIQPSSVSWAITESLDENGECTISDRTLDELFAIRVVDGDGRAVGEVDLTISLITAGNTASSALNALYDDRNGNGIADPDELVSDVGDPLLFTKTSKYNGVKTVIVRFNISCEQGPVLNVFADGRSARAEINVVNR